MAAFQRSFSKRGTGVFVCLMICALAGITVVRGQGGFSTLKEKVTLNYFNTNAAVIFQSLQQQTSYTFSFDNGMMQSVIIDSLIVKNGTLGGALSQLNRKTGLLFSVMGNKNIAVQRGKPPVKEVRLTGQVIDEKSGQPVAGATVKVGGKIQTTDVEGKYSLLLPPGSYEAEVSFVGYQGKKVTDIVAGQEELLSLDISVMPQAGTLSGVMVTAGMRRESVAALYVKQRNNTAISDGISAEQIRATADNNAGQVLKRVSGVVVQNDKFVTIRGVSDRYNNVLINGAMLPSTEPNRRNFSFDIVPSGLIDNIIINKTATPDMPSEFTGGFVQINTKDVPASNFFNITVGSGFNTVSAGWQMRDRKRYDGDYFGAVGNARKWFGSAVNPRDYVKAVLTEDYPYMAKAGSKMPNNWASYQYPYAPVQNYQLSGGMLFKLKNDQSFGFTAGATYRNEQTVEAGEKRSLANSEYETERYRFVSAIGGLANMAYKTKRFKIAFKNLYNRRFTSQYDYDNGHDFNINKQIDVRNTSSNILVNELVQNRLEGEHVIGKKLLRIDWYADRNKLVRQQPDTRYTRGERGDGSPYYEYDFVSTTLEFGALYASRLEENRKNAGINIAVPFSVAGNAELIKVGYSYSKRDALYTGSGFRLLDKLSGENASRFTGLPFEQIATSENISKGYLYYAPAYIQANNTGDGYQGDQKLHSAYLMGDFRLFQQLRVTGGMRYEQNDITLNTLFFSYNVRDSLQGGKVPTEKSWLPSVNLIYNLTSKMNLRASYGETLARPDFVERTPFIYYDFPEQLYVYGDHAIKTTKVKNYDVRLEYYPTSNEVASVSFFYKDFSNPVERFFLLGNPSNAVSYGNLDKANVKGIELDVRKSLDFINPGSVLRNFYITGNYSYLRGKIDTYADRFDSADMQIKRVKIQSNRPVQGLAPYVINAGLNYQSNNLGFNITYNRFGRRIVYGGTYEQYIQYEVPRDILDLQLSVQLMRRKLELRLNASDLLNQAFVIYSNSTPSASGGDGVFNKDPKGAAYNPAYDFINYKVKRGTNYSFVITYKL